MIVKKLKLKDALLLKEDDSPFNFTMKPNGGVYSLFNHGSHVISFSKEDWFVIKSLIEKEVK